MDLLSKPVMKSMETVRANPTSQTTGQLRTITSAVGHAQTRVLTSGTSIAHSANSSLIGQATQGTLKQVSVPRTNVVTTCSANNTITLTQSASSMMSPRPHVTVASAVAVNATTASYHVPRGAAAVANIAAPRSAVATPIVRATTLQTAGSTHSTSFVSGIRAMNPGSLVTRAGSPAASVVTGTMWLGGTTVQTTTITTPKSVSPRPLLTTTRASSITTIPTYTQGRQTSVTVTTRPVAPPGNRTQAESPRPQILQTAGQKPLTVSQAGTQLHIADGSYFKAAAVTVPSSVPSSVPGTTSTTQVLTTRTQTQAAYSNSTVVASAVQFSTSAASHGTTVCGTTVRVPNQVPHSSQRVTSTVLSPPSQRTSGPVTPSQVSSGQQATSRVNSVATRPVTLPQQTVSQPVVASTHSGTVGSRSSAGVGVTSQQIVSTQIQPQQQSQQSSQQLQSQHSQLQQPQQTQQSQQQASQQQQSQQVGRTSVASGSVGTHTRLAVAPAPSPSRTVTAQPSQSRAVAPAAAVIAASSVARLGQAVAPSSVVSLHPVVVSGTTGATGTVPLKPVTHAQIAATTGRTGTPHQNVSHKVITQPVHGQSIQITQVPVSSVSGKLPQTLHTVTPLQQAALTITTGTPRTVTYATTTTLAGSAVSTLRPVTVSTTPAIPVAKVLPQAVSVGRAANIELASTPVSEVALHPMPAPTAQQPTVVAAQQTISQATSVYIQTSHRASPAPSSTQVTVERAATSLPTYSIPTATYYYEPSTIGYQVAGVSGSLVARTYNAGTPYSVQANTTPTVRPGVTTQVHGIVTSGQPVRFNPVVVVDPSRSSVPVHSSFVTEGTLVPAENSVVVGQTSQVQPVTKQNASPRPSILRKRDNEGSPLKAQKNLAPVLAALSTPPSPPSPRRPDSRGNGGISSGGSTTISATSSPGLGEGGDDSLPPIKQEPHEDGDKPPVEMSPRKKPRKQQLTRNELHEPKFSEDEMEFISEEKVKKEVKEVAEETEERIYIPKRPPISLISSYRQTWKSRHNHFLRYSDVKPKDERRPTVSDLANQKHVLQKLNGWKVYHLSTQMEDMSELETQVFERLTNMLKYMERRTGKDTEKDVNRVVELIKGNIQRSKVISDQMQEAKLQVMKVFDHKSHVAEIITRCANKRSLKKRDKS
ncbi:LOW QUALITY PROTEIN: mucin-5AC [Schistocerca americana]|uniref:LOW QUALITY PROTEIN: mucin-5AC n=1 Tax=Schistocerca americana TaxID=7009 RepID=UPI001F4FE7DD|nr:LOW QUALITY PROTEIN: mucin-5AC [Schistocerca americana]XP_047107259.1 mucin-5AC isoform X1 [Schistocerca piceifrons]XP_047107260.1 mucin-5AC isoform X1 [Schistocerca piceifrons]